MTKINFNFNIPYYIFEEVLDYVENKNDGKNKCMKKENIYRLLDLAVSNNTITEEQSNYIKQKYCN